MSRCSRYSHLPNVNDPACIPAWDYKSLPEKARNTLLALYNGQALHVDALGSTDDLTRMALLFSAETGIPTTPACLYQNLMRMRKGGSIPARRQPFKLVPLAQGTPEVPA